MRKREKRETHLGQGREGNGVVAVVRHLQSSTCGVCNAMQEDGNQWRLRLLCCSQQAAQMQATGESNERSVGTKQAQTQGGGAR